MKERARDVGEGDDDPVVYAVNVVAGLAYGCNADRGADISGRRAGGSGRVLIHNSRSIRKAELTSTTNSAKQSVLPLVSRHSSNHEKMHTTAN